MAENGIKVSQIAKDLKVTSKDITERLAGFGITVKGTSVLTEEQLGLVFDIYTNLHDLGDAPIVKPEPKKEEPKAVKPRPIEESNDSFDLGLSSEDNQPAPAPVLKKNIEKEDILKY